MPKTLKAKIDHFNRYDDITPNEILRASGRIQSTTESETPRRRRQIVARCWDFHEPFSFIWDELETMREKLDDDEYQRNIVKGFQRNRDDVWAAAIDAVAVEVDVDADPPTTGNLAFSEATPGVAIDPDGAGTFDNNTVVYDTPNPDGTSLITGLTVGKLVALAGVLDLLDVDDDRAALMHSTQKMQLRNDIKATSGDFGVKRLESGELVGMLGFEFIISNRIAAQLGSADGFDGSTGGRYVYGCSRRAVRTGTYRGFMVLLSRDPEQQHRFLVSHYDWAAATRAFEEDAARAACEDVATA